MAEAGDTASDIAVNLGLSVGVVSRAIARAVRSGRVTPESKHDRLPALPVQSYTLRRCLGCNKDFPSVGRQNRMCASCKDSASTSLA